MGAFSTPLLMLYVQLLRSFKWHKILAKSAIDRCKEQDSYEVDPSSCQLGTAKMTSYGIPQSHSNSIMGVHGQGGQWGCLPLDYCFLGVFYRFQGPFTRV